MTEYRKAHPYFMYEAIEQQPDRVAQVLERQGEAINRAAVLAAARQRIIFLGIGTSYHAALLGEFRPATRPPLPARASYFGPPNVRARCLIRWRAAHRALGTWNWTSDTTQFWARGLGPGMRPKIAKRSRR